MRVRGTCYALFAFDLGYAIDLDRAGELVASEAGRKVFRNPRRAPSGEGTRPRPLLLSRAAEPIDVGGDRTVAAVEILLYDFGGASVTYPIPVDADVGDLPALADRLYDNAVLTADARRRMEETLSVIASAVSRPGLSPLVEDYLVLELLLPDGVPVGALLEDHAAAVARTLRAEPGDLSDDEIREALARRLSYGANELAIVDWYAAILVGEGREDERAVLEFANVELLEWRLLDLLLDRAVDTAFEAVNRRERGLGLFASRSEALRRVARMQMDYAFLFEGVSHSMKLLGDQYLARLYQAASERFHLPEWEAAIHRKLGVLGGVQEKLAAVASARRMELLEWIIIVLIALSIAVYFLPQ